MPCAGPAYAPTPSKVMPNFGATMKMLRNPIGRPTAKALSAAPSADIAKEDHARLPVSARNTAARGRVILNSVNSPGWVSTSIDPPCCLTMMS